MRSPGLRCHSRSSVLIAVFGMLLGACVSSPALNTGDAGRDPAMAFADLEARLLGAPRVQIRFTATAEGAVAASLRGTLNAVRPSSVELMATGEFVGNNVEASLRTQGDSLEVRTGGRTNREELPVAVNDAVLIGLTRMGILHNVARMTSGYSPDRAAGGVREWVTVTSVAVDDGAHGPRRGLLALRFDIMVAGQRSGEATLWLDPASGLPVHRKQTVFFPNGQNMVVTESYEYSFP